MKPLVKLYTIYAFLLITAGIMTRAVLREPISPSSFIVGTWISEADSNWRLKFTADRCYQYYADTLSETDSYTISNTSPQCGTTVPITNNTLYLKLADLNDSTDIICYEINGIEDSSLSLSVVNRGGQLVFDRRN